MATEYRQPDTIDRYLEWGKNNYGKLIVAFLVLFVLFLAYFSIQEYERGVVLRWGKFNRVAEPGLNWKIPFAESVVRMPTEILSSLPPERVDYKGDKQFKSRHANTYTSDNQEIDIMFTVLFRIPSKNVAFVWENARDYEPKLLSIAEDRLKAEMGKVQLEHFAENRGSIRDKVKAVLAKDAPLLGLEITDFQLSDVQYTNAFRKAVEAASVEKARVETREWERQQAEKAALTREIKERGEANAVREKAKGEADSIDFVAKAQARSIQVKGEAEAAAIRAQAKALSENQRLVELRTAERWNGTLPLWVVPGGPLPFLNVEPPSTKR